MPEKLLLAIDLLRAETIGSFSLVGSFLLVGSFSSVGPFKTNSLQMVPLEDSSRNFGPQKAPEA